MINRTVVTTVLLLLLSAAVKAHMALLKLLLLAGAGVAGLYMIHLLAQDYNKYQANRPHRALGLVSSLISKRSIPDGEYEMNFARDVDDRPNFLPDLDAVLRFDPTGCARRYVCTIATKSTKKLTEPERNMLDMLRDLSSRAGTDQGQDAFKAAIDLGRRTRDADACTAEYPKCIFTVSEMLKLIGVG